MWLSRNDLVCRLMNVEYALKKQESNTKFLSDKLDSSQGFTGALLKQLKLKAVKQPPQDAKWVFEKETK